MYRRLGSTKCIDLSKDLLFWATFIALLLIFYSSSVHDFWSYNDMFVKVIVFVLTCSIGEITQGSMFNIIRHPVE